MLLFASKRFYVGGTEEAWSSPHGLATNTKSIIQCFASWAPIYKLGRKMLPLPPIAYTKDL